MAETPISRPPFNPSASAASTLPAPGPIAGSGAGAAAVTPPADTVTVTIDGRVHQFPKGTNLLEACNQTGANVPFFCYHPGLSSPAVSRQLLVEPKGRPKAVPSCHTPLGDKMEVDPASARLLDVRRQM